MDNFDQNMRYSDTGMTAQRRHRRRPAENPVVPEMKTADPESIKEAPETEATGAENVREMPEAETAGTESLKEIPETEAAVQAVREAPETEDAVQAVRETLESAEAPAGPDAEEAALREETLTTAQSADSRVPAEARRMAAAPYGTVWPEQRKPEPARPEAGSAGIRPRPATGRGGVSAEPGSGERSANRKASGQRVRVGYAPGRMNEGVTMLMTSREQEDAASQAFQQARDYLEKHGKTGRRGGAGKNPRGRKTLRIVIIVLLVLAAAAAGFLIWRGKNKTADPGKKETSGVLSFEPGSTEGVTAPADVMFSVVTEKDIQQIRLKDEDGSSVAVDTDVADNAEGKAWLLTLHVESGFEGTVRLEVSRDGETWTETEYTNDIRVRSAPATPTPEPQPMSAAAEEPAEPDGSAGDEESGDASGEEGTAPEETGASEPEAGDTVGEEEPEESEDTEWAEGEEESEVREDAESEDADTEIREAGELRTAEPTNTPAPQEEAPTPTPALTAEAAPEANPDRIIVSETIYNGKKKEKEYSRAAKNVVRMPAADEYTSQNLGVMTFRGDNFRRNAAVGSLDGEASGLRIIWQVEGGSSRGVNQSYYGYGWTGQPVIARWSKQVRGASNLYESKQTKEKLKEVIIAGLDGNIRFLDLDDGSLTRNSIKLGYPMRGTPSLHTRGAPFISVGQFARKMKVKTGSIGLRQYNLYNQKELKILDGLDTKAHRALNNVGSFETAALIDRVNDNLIVAGSNGMLYLEALDSTFDYNAGVLTVSPEIMVMVSKAKGQKNTALAAVESSLAAYDKYVYYADMGGVLRCVNTDILRTVWAAETGDAVMAAVALDLTENRELNLYTANMLTNRKKGNNDIQIRRYDALSGREIWCTEVGVYKGKKDKDDVGAKASPVIGQKRLSGLVYFTVTGLSEEGRVSLGLGGEEAAALIALDKETGKLVWTAGLDSRSESSPTAVYDVDGNGWILQCEQNGIVHLLEGLTGREVASLQLKTNEQDGQDVQIEASPAVYNNMMVIGSTGKGTSFIYGIEISTAQAPGEVDEPEEPESAEAEVSGEPEEAEEGEDSWEGEDEGE